VKVDLAKDRVYLPLTVIDRHGYTLQELKALKFRPQFRAAMREAVEVARRLFVEGLPLAKTVDRRLSFDLELFSRGGLRVLEKIEQQDYNVLAKRPVVSKIDRVQLLLASLWSML